MNISQSLNTWSPYAVLIIIVAVAFLGIICWYAFHFQNPPEWLLTIFATLGGGGLFGIGAAHGVSVANGVAKDTAVAVVQATESTQK